MSSANTGTSCFRIGFLSLWTTDDPWQWAMGSCITCTTPDLSVPDPSSYPCPGVTVDARNPRAKITAGGEMSSKKNKKDPHQSSLLNLCEFIQRSAE